MVTALPMALLLSAETAAYGPAPPPVPKAAAKASPEQCPAPTGTANQREIVICAQRPNGYRLNPDVLEARREMRQSQAGRPHNPHEMMRDNSCSTVGPMGCRGGPTINILTAAATAVEMAKRLSKGEEIGSMFMTDPHPSEYDLYKEAKARREAREAEATAKAAAAKKAAAAPAPVSTPRDTAAAQR